MADVMHIRGDTFSVSGQVSGGDRTGWTGRSQVRDLNTDELLSNLTFAWMDASTGSFFVQTLETDNWPAPGYVVFDVEITSPEGVKLSSPAVRITVMRDVTR